MPLVPKIEATAVPGHKSLYIIYEPQQGDDNVQKDRRPVASTVLRDVT